MVFRFIYIALISYLTLTGCSRAPVVPVQADIPPEIPKSTRVADKPFSADTLYALLVAELALGRNRHDIALNNYVQQATKTRDAGIAEHATHLARMLRAPDDALNMAELWTEVEPKNLEARTFYASSLVGAKRFDEAFEQARILVESGEPAAFEELAAHVAQSDAEVRLAMEAKYQDLLAEHPDNISLLVGHSLLLEQLNKPKEALAAARRALKVENDSVTALYQEARLLQVLGENAQAMEKMGSLVEANPGNHRLRLRYARALVDVDLSTAHAQYLVLYKQLPFDQDVIFTLALIERELQMYEAAEERFFTLIARQQHISASHYQLAKIFEAQNRPDKALPHYLDVSEGENYSAALNHAARILFSQEKQDEALNLVRLRRSAQAPAHRESLFMLEADLLVQLGNNSAAERVLSEGIKQLPESDSLLYSRAMLYTRIDFIEAAEKDLLIILEKKPNDAAALNALGYTLADKTDRLEDAHNYITRALQLTPDDPAVLDSMGWLQYRQGNLKDALLNLRKAMKTMPDHEIAAHLGEVLWMSGDQEEAKTVWRAGLALTPQSKIIHQTILKLNATIH